jgi:hypothetical protein
MRVLKRNPWLTGLGTVLSLVGLWWGSARAGVATTDQTASLIVFPKVIADGTRDTLIQLVNASNFNNYTAHCKYLRATGQCFANPARICTSDFECGTEGPCNAVNNTWQELDFDVQLTRQQPYVWRVSTGRQQEDESANVPRGQCLPAQPGPSGQQCNGFSTGVPAVAAGFRGELRCYEVDGPVNGSPVQENALKGEAILEEDANSSNAAQIGPQISEYNAIGFRGLNVMPDTTLGLDNHEYDACPQSLQFDHYAVGAPDLAAQSFSNDGIDPPDACDSSNGGCPVDTEVTIVPCSIDYAGEPTRVTAQVVVTDELETTLSTPFDFTCYFNARLGDISSVFDVGTGLAGSFRRTSVRPADGGRCIDVSPQAKCSLTTQLINDSNDPNFGDSCICRPTSGLLAVMEEFHSSSITSTVGTAAFNGHTVGSRGQCHVSRNDCTEYVGTQFQDMSCCSDSSAGLCGGGTIPPATPVSCSVDSECSGQPNGNTTCLVKQNCSGVDPTDLCESDTMNVTETNPAP